MTDDEFDSNHPYVRRLIGCGHGRLFTEPCVDCEIAGLREQYSNAIRTVGSVCARLHDLGAPVPGGWVEAQKAAKKDKS